MSKQIIYGWADGGCRGNGREGNIGANACYMEYWIDGELKHKKTISGGERNTTNNIQELKGCINLLKAIKNKQIPIVIHLDSNYVIQGITRWIKNWESKGWVTAKKQPVLNKELWVELNELKSQFKDIRFVKVKGHDGEMGNEIVDKLCNEYMDKMQ